MKQVYKIEVIVNTDPALWVYTIIIKVGREILSQYSGPHLAAQLGRAAEWIK